MLLIEYLEQASDYLREHKIQIHKLERQFRTVYDTDLKRESTALWRDVRRKKGEIIDQLLLNLDEFRALRKYFPEVLQTILEDKYVGPVVSKKIWLLDFKQTPSQLATMKLEQLLQWRLELKAARESLRGSVGTINANHLLTRFPILRGFISGDLAKADVIDAITKAEKVVLREGWLLLLSDSLIKIPITKFLGKVNQHSYEEMIAKKNLARVIGKGTVAETIAGRKLEEVSRNKNRYERILRQILLANPGYLRSLKQKKSWMSREKQTGLDKFVKNITPHTLKERAWLDEMKKKLN
jgi:hypothetical protein